MVINSEVFKSYLVCRHKALLKTTGHEGVISVFEQSQRTRFLEYRKQTAKMLVRTQDVNAELWRESHHNSDLTRGEPYLLSATVTDYNSSAQIDILEKAKGSSALGAYFYVPYLLLPDNRFGKDDKLLLAFYARVLGKAQQRKVNHGTILYGTPMRRRRIDVTRYQHVISSAIQAIGALSDKDATHTFILNRHCQACEFRKHCEAEAIVKDDLSLLRGMREKEIAAQNSKGIFTVTQYSYTFRPRKRRKPTGSRPKRRYHALQALAIREHKTFVYGAPVLPDTTVEIYMDIETVPYRDFVYLIGLIVDTHEDIHELSFWANSEGEEESIVEQLLSAVSAFGTFTLLHYGSIEMVYLKRLARTYTGKHKSTLDLLIKGSVNVLSLIYDCFYFPVYENSLKAIAGHIGFTWSEDDPSGLNSIAMREAWNATGDCELRSRLVTYNRQDCQALRMVLAHLRYLDEMDRSGNRAADSGIAFATDYVSTDSRVFRSNEFLIKDLAYINRCAYFDYQRDKISIRTNKELKKRINRQVRSRNTLTRPNKTITFDNITRCPYCQSSRMNRYGHYQTSVADLKFTKGGVRRWVLKYDIHIYKCRACNGVYNYKNECKRFGGRVGDNLICWIVYETLAKGVSLNKISDSLEDQFNLLIPVSTLFDTKSFAAAYYESVNRRILDRLLNGPVIHVDETPVKLKGHEGYVWVFTNGEEVLFLYRSTREGVFLRELLDGYRGVLVSDFYSAYDSIDCSQQKCLIHLMRDLNDDLHGNPFDEEFRHVVRSFGALLRSIVETVDKHGLKGRYLRKHNRDVDRFDKTMVDGTYRSEVALKYQKRFRKNHGKLFAFLNYNGVPWNNNAAEHAIKSFATLRRRANGLFSEKGLVDYLILLSVYQTCKYRQANFLKFLLSGEKEIP